MQYSGKLVNALFVPNELDASAKGRQGTRTHYEAHYDKATCG